MTLDLRGLVIAGLPARDVSKALAEFKAMESELDTSGDVPKIIRKILTADFLARILSVTLIEAEAVLDELINKNYVDVTKLVPASEGVALSMGTELDRITFDIAQSIVEEFLAAVHTSNNRPGARVFIQRVKVFGSFARREATVGDIDLQVEAPVEGDDCQPEDLDERDQVLASLEAISEYISIHSEFDSIAADAYGDVIYEKS